MQKFKVLNIMRHRFNIDGTGITTLVGLSNCPLNCKYCINKMVLAQNNYKSYTPEELINEIIIDYCYFISTGGGITFGGGEPLLHTEAIIEFSKKIPEGINITLETSLNVSNNLLKIILPYTNNFIIDIKTMNPKIYKKYTKKNINNLLTNLKYLEENNLQEKCLIRIPLIKNYNNHEDVQNSIKILEEMGFRKFDIFEYIIKEKNKEKDKAQVEFAEKQRFVGGCVSESKWKKEEPKNKKFEKRFKK